MKNKRYTMTLAGLWLVTAVYGICSLFRLDVFPVDRWIAFILHPFYTWMFGGGQIS
ncbi:hypothetical protein [Bacillus sp. FJAT-42376]|uniref:hypothetical protein n=1 Tax=Bacillus sp. FJAT-42376 TaxID=2014076 RepID=UPI0013DE57AA|nr:hypothetical protein [Bacillus sp. FJAT-42376]